MTAVQYQQDIYEGTGQVMPGLYDATLASTVILQTISEHNEDKSY